MHELIDAETKPQARLTSLGSGGGDGVAVFRQRIDQATYTRKDAYGAIGASVGVQVAVS